ncbi:MAG: MmcQ/YjbR family DNA-binding protein [Actinomycetota bacterium]|nr:MmcQ/YjbR family DNA-binding protein [Acidimicrobiia bacterium]MDQ3468549.1 MmcQ/YjbR family DNA-binding protein [Actinomycetota bacterium]
MYDRRLVEPALAEVRRFCLGLPEVEDRLSHGAPTFFVRGKKTFVTFLDNHHDDGRLAIWCAAPPGVQGQVVEQEPARFFRPPYVGGRGWLGVRLDVEPDWTEIAKICADAYRHVAPPRLRAELDARGGTT